MNAEDVESVEVFDDESNEAELASLHESIQNSATSSAPQEQQQQQQQQQQLLQQPEQQRRERKSSDGAGEILFEDVVVKLVGSVVRLDIKSKAYTSYIIIVTCHDVERWRIEKRYSAFFELDEKVSQTHTSLHLSFFHLNPLLLLLTVAAETRLPSVGLQNWQAP